MAINTRSRPYINTIDDIVNKSFDGENDLIVVEPVGFDGVAMQRSIASSVAVKITEDGNHTYIAIAAPGTAQATAKWQIRDLFQDGNNTVITWADGNANFDNVATDLPALSYS